MNSVLHFRQIFRKPFRTLLYVLLLALLTTFFSLSLNLYRNSRENIRLADETYSTIAVMELYADVDSRGNLLAEVGGVEDYAGYQALTAYGYDLSPIVHAPGVEKYDLRARYGAFAEGELACRPSGIRDSIDRMSGPMFCDDVIRFKVIEDVTESHQGFGLSGKPAEDEPAADDGLIRIACLGISKSISGQYLRTEFLDSANGAFEYEKDITPVFWLSERQAEHYAAEIACLNGTEAAEHIVLEPGTEYVGLVSASSMPPGFMRTDSGLYYADSINFKADSLFVDRYYYYSALGGEDVDSTARSGQPFWLYRYADVLADSALAEQLEQIRRAYYINARSFGVMATDDLLGVPAFHLGNMFMKEGRTISDAEYGSGARVCIISSDLARAQGWEVGNAVEFQYYEYDHFVNATLWGSELAPRYTYSDPQNFFDGGSYEIVGIYEMRPIVGTSTVSEAALSVPWNTIFVPKRSIRNAPAESELPVSGALLTLWIENGKIEPFLEEMDALGITGQKAGDYEAKFTFYDQGYSNIQPSLNALSGTAELLLILSSVLLLTAAVLLAFFFVLSQKQNLGVMRMLGCSGARAFCTVFLSALLIAALGVGAGAAAGHALTEQVGQRILAEANTASEAYRAFSAYIASGQNAAMEFALGASVRTTAFALAAALGLFLLGTAAFTLRYLAKEPRALLPESHV